jgi:hypothetical protein
VSEERNEIIDLHFFRHDYLRSLDNPRLGIDFKKLEIPNAQDFTISDYSFSGYPQTSLASKEVLLISFEIFFFVYK